MLVVPPDQEVVVEVEEEDDEWWWWQFCYKIVDISSLPNFPYWVFWFIFIFEATYLVASSYYSRTTEELEYIFWETVRWIFIQHNIVAVYRIMAELAQSRHCKMRSKNRD